MLIRAAVNSEHVNPAFREIEVPRAVRVGAWLIAHREMKPNRQGGGYVSGHDFSVTHKPTGQMLMDGFPRLKDSVAYAERIKGMVPWGEVTHENAWAVVPRAMQMQLIEIAKEYGRASIRTLRERIAS